MELLDCSKEHWLTMSVVDKRTAIMNFQEQCLAHESEQGIEIPVKEFFCDGIYAREAVIPKGTVFVGEIHKHRNISVISQGTIRVVTEFGIETIVAPHTFIAEAGTKRIGFAMEDTVWTVFHRTDATTEAGVRADCIVDNYTQLGEKS